MARKKRKSLLPKRIAGVKVPKSVRQGRLGELLASQTGQALLAEAVLAAGALGAAKKVADDAGEKSASAPSLRSFATNVAGRVAPGGGREAAASGAALAIALGEAARAFVNALNAHQKPAEPAAPDLEAEWRANDDEHGRSKKKPTSSPPRPA